MQFCPERRLRRCENKCGEKCIHPETKQWTCNQVFYHRLDPAARLDAYLAVQPLLGSRGRQKHGIHMFTFSEGCFSFWICLFLCCVWTFIFIMICFLCFVLFIFLSCSCLIFCFSSYLFCSFFLFSVCLSVFLLLSLVFCIAIYKFEDTRQMI